MNVFFIMGDTAYTQDLESGTILRVLPGKCDYLVKGSRIESSGMSLNIDDIVDAYKAEKLFESFWHRNSCHGFNGKGIAIQDFVMNLV